MCPHEEEEGLSSFTGAHQREIEMLILLVWESLMDQSMAPNDEKTDPLTPSFPTKVFGSDPNPCGTYLDWK